MNKSPLTEARIRPLLRGAPEGLSVRVVEACDSTNSVLKREAPSLPADFVLIARRQTGGRGRLGRKFYSPKGAGLYMSLLLRPSFPKEDLTLITPAAAVAVCRAVESVCGTETAIKWVNDVYARGKKICGILTEAVFTPSGALSHAVLGIGVNVSPPPEGFPQELADIAGTALDEPAPELLPRLAAQVISEFYSLYRALPDADQYGAYAPRLLYVGRHVTVHRGGQSRRALVLGTDARCRLLVEYEDGEREALSGGEITVRPAENRP